MPATMTAPGRRGHHRLSGLVERDRAAKQLAGAVQDASRAARHGIRSTKILQLEKDIGTGKNRACHSVIELLFTAMDNGVAIDKLEHVARTLVGLLRTRAGLAPAETLNQLIRHEGDIDCRLDAVELALHDGECSSENLAAADELITQQIDALLALRDKVNERRFACGLRMVAL